MCSSVTKREIVSFGVTPIIFALVCGSASWALTGGEIFVPMLVLWIALVPGYVVVLLVALPLYAWLKFKHHGVGWKGILLAGALCGMLTPLVLCVSPLLDAIFRAETISGLEVFTGCDQLSVIGLISGVTMAVIFRLVAGDGQ